MAITAHLTLPGTSGNYASAPDTAALSITSDITLLCRLALDSWAPLAVQTVIAKHTASGNQLAYCFDINGSGVPRLTLSTAGTSGTAVVTASSAAVPVSNGVIVWLLASWRNSDDRLQFFTADGSIASPVASDFTQLGTDRTLAATGIFDSTAVLEVGSRDVGTVNRSTGKFYRAKIYNGVFSTSAFGGTLQFDADFTAVTVTAVRTPTSFTESSSNAATVTENGSAWSWGVQDARSVGGTITPAGTAQRVTAKALAGPMTPSGVATKNTAKPLSGTASSAGALSRTTKKAVTGTVTPSGSIAKAVARFLSGAVTPSGVATKNTAKPLSGRITPTGSVRKTALKALVGVISAAGNAIVAVFELGIFRSGTEPAVAVSGRGPVTVAYAHHPVISASAAIGAVAASGTEPPSTLTGTIPELVRAGREP